MNFTKRGRSDMVHCASFYHEKVTLDRLCYLFMIFLAGCLVLLLLFLTDCLLSALFRMPITY